MRSSPILSTHGALWDALKPTSTTLKWRRHVYKEVYRTAFLNFFVPSPARTYKAVFCADPSRAVRLKARRGRKTSYWAGFSLWLECISDIRYTNRHVPNGSVSIIHGCQWNKNVFPRGCGRFWIEVLLVRWYNVCMVVSFPPTVSSL